jgi:predicted metal-dependent phosphoesterase TrpH
MSTLLAGKRREPGVLDPERARILLAEGWRAADLHVHTLHSYDVIPTPQVDPLTLYHKARRLGMSYIAFTDHDTMAAYDQIGWTREDLVPAVEVKLLDSKNVGHTIHVNVYTLNPGQFGEIRKIVANARDVGTLTEYLRAENLPYVFNHPFWHEPDETPNLQAVLDIAPLFPVLEYNMGRTARINAQALKLAAAASKGVVAGTDSHVGDIGRAFSLARGAAFKEFFGRIAARESHICPADLTLPRIKEETSIRIRRLFDRAAWLHAKETLAMDTGSPLLDAVIRRAARRKPDVPDPTGWIVGRLVEALSSTGIPGALYLRSQDSLAERIGRLLESAEIAA